MTVVQLFAHGHIEAYAQGTDEIALLLAVVGDGVHHLHLVATLVEIESNCEGQPRAALSRVVTVDADHGAHLSLAFPVCGIDTTGEIAETKVFHTILIRLVLRGANQSSAFCNLRSIEDETVNQSLATSGEIGFQGTGRYDKTLVPLGCICIESIGFTNYV